MFFFFLFLSQAARRLGGFGGLVGMEVFVPRTKLWMDRKECVFKRGGMSLGKGDITDV